MRVPKGRTVLQYLAPRKLPENWSICRTRHFLKGRCYNIVGSKETTEPQWRGKSIRRGKSGLPCFLDHMAEQVVPSQSRACIEVPCLFSTATDPRGQFGLREAHLRALLANCQTCLFVNHRLPDVAYPSLLSDFTV